MFKAPTGSSTPDEIVEQVIRAGKHWISVTKLEHTPVIRICITNGLSTTKDVDRLVELLVSAAQSPCDANQKKSVTFANNRRLLEN